VASDDRGLRASWPIQGDARTLEVTGLWQTATTDIRNPINVTQCTRVGGGFSVRDPEPGTPWTFSLAQAGTTLSGTLQESGPDNWCAPDPVPIEDGTIEGDQLSFRVVSPSGSTVEFRGVVQADGSSIAVTRSPVAPGAAAPGPNNLGPFSVQSAFYRSFVVQRVASPAGNGCPDRSPLFEPAPLARCEAADPQAPPFTTGASRWVATDGVGFSPWTFDLTIGLHGVVTGSVGQGAMDAQTRLGPASAGPFAIASGQADARRLSLTVRSPDDTRVVRFSGVRRGPAAIDFRRTVITLSRFSSAPTFLDLFGLGPGAVTEFTAWRVSSDPTTAPPEAQPGGRADDTVTLESLEARFAVVPASPPDGSAALSPEALTRPAFVLVRYQVQPTFQGRLAVLALDATGPIRQFDVVATAGPHVALWDLRAAGPAPAGATEQDLRVAETRARIVASAIRLATDVPSEAAAAGLAATLSDMLVGPGGTDATEAGSRFAAPGNYTIALARVDSGSLTVLATRLCVVTATSGK
jgi:hypothetical protein